MAPRSRAVSVRVSGAFLFVSTSSTIRPSARRVAIRFARAFRVSLPRSAAKSRFSFLASFARRPRDGAASASFAICVTRGVSRRRREVSRVVRVVADSCRGLFRWIDFSSSSPHLLNFQQSALAVATVPFAVLFKMWPSRFGFNSSRVGSRFGAAFAVAALRISEKVARPIVAGKFVKFKFFCVLSVQFYFKQIFLLKFFSGKFIYTIFTQFEQFFQWTITKQTVLYKPFLIYGNMETKS